MSSTSISPLTYARPSPSWPGERSMCPSARGERTRNVGPPAPLVGGEGAAIPQLQAEGAVGKRPRQRLAQRGGDARGAHRP